MDYKSAGVDIEAGYQSVELLKEHVKGTMRPEVLGGLGGFSGAFCLDKIKEMEHPVLLSGTDGVGTKIKLAFLMDKHDTVGIDCVAMCVNDVARRAAFLPGLYCLRQELSGEDRCDRGRCSRRLQTGRRSSCRRRDCGASGSDAGGRV